MNESKVEQAVAKFNSGFACSQSILSTYCDSLGLDKETALKLAEAFGGGIGGLGMTCGAVSGAIMIIALQHGRTAPDDEDAKQNTRALIRDFISKFEARNNSSVCNTLVGYDISTPIGKRAAEQQGVFDTRCPNFVKDAAEILEEMMA